MRRALMSQRTQLRPEEAELPHSAEESIDRVAVPVGTGHPRGRQ